jgi:8-oxo-dGTP pyrophosphatase MutT (NUDIX family)
MEKKTKKSQIVIAAIDENRQSFSFLLLQTNKQRGHFWQNVTGKIEKDETYEEGGLREAIEETSLKVESIIDIVDLGITHTFTDERKRNVHERSFLIIADTKWDVKIDPKEHESFKWIPIEELDPDLVKHKGNFEALEKSQLLLKHWGM